MWARFLRWAYRQRYGDSLGDIYRQIESELPNSVASTVTSWLAKQPSSLRRAAAEWALLRCRLLGGREDAVLLMTQKNRLTVMIDEIEQGRHVVPKGMELSQLKAKHATQEAASEAIKQWFAEQGTEEAAMAARLRDAGVDVDGLVGELRRHF